MLTLNWSALSTRCNVIGGCLYSKKKKSESEKDFFIFTHPLTLTVVVKLATKLWSLDERLSFDHHHSCFFFAFFLHVYILSIQSRRWLVILCMVSQAYNRVIVLVHSQDIDFQKFVWISYFYGYYPIEIC